MHPAVAQLTSASSGHRKVRIVPKRLSAAHAQDVSTMKSMSEIETFCRQVRARSAENRQAMDVLHAVVRCLHVGHVWGGAPARLTGRTQGSQVAL